MKNVKEWLSDNLRYVMLGAAVIFVIVILFLAFRLLRPYYGEGETNKSTETQKIQEKTEKTEKTTSSKKEDTQKVTESSKSSVTEKTTGTSATTESDKKSSEKSSETTAQTKASETQAPATEAPVYETEAAQTEWQEPQTEWSEEVQESQLQDLGTITMNANAYIRQDPSYEGAILGELQAGQNVTFLEDAGGWYKVDADGMVGYVGARFFD